MAQAFLAPLQTALACVAHAKITPSPGGRAQPGKVHAWTINSGAGAELHHYRLKAAMQYELIEEDSERGPWRATTRGYMYSIETSGDSELLSAHWHPTGKSHHKEPHLHVSHNVVNEEGGFLAREPLYTGRFTF